MSTTEDRAEELTVYEIGYLILPSIPEDSLPSTVAKINESIEKAGGKRLEGEDPFLHPLAYQMKKSIGARKYVVDEAYLGWVKFEAEPSSVEAIKSDLEKTEEILRFLLVKTPRETQFTFAKAQEEKARADKEREEKAAEAAVAPDVVE